MLNALKAIISPKAFVKHEFGNIILSELNPDAKLKKVSLRLTAFLKGSSGLIKNAIVIIGDGELEFKQFTNYLNENCPNVTKQCDYIIFHSKNDVIRIILCELKSSEQSLNNGARIHNQFLFSKVFAEYLTGVAKTFYDVESRLLNETVVEFHYLAFVHVPSVVSSMVLGHLPIMNIKKINNIHCVFTPTDSNGKANFNWKSLMESIN